MRSSDPKSARFGTLTVCLIAALMPLSSVGAQVIGQPGGRQRATPDLMALILYLPPINLGGGTPPPPGPQGGREAEGAVILSGNAPAGGAVITLSSGNTALLHVPATVTVPAGANSVKFRYDPLPVTESTTATASAVYGAQTKTASVLILPPQLEAITLDSLQVQGGRVMYGWVKLNGVGPSDKDIGVKLSSNNPAVSVPAEVLLRGVLQQPFHVTSKGVGQPAAVVISASLAGRTRAASLKVVPATLLNLGYYQTTTNLWFEVSNCSAPNNIPLSAKLSGQSPFDGGAAIELTSSNPQLLPVPATISIAPTAIQAVGILVHCSAPATESIVNITGTYLGVTRTYRVTVKPLPPPEPTTW